MGGKVESQFSCSGLGSTMDDWPLTVGTLRAGCRGVYRAGRAVDSRAQRLVWLFDSAQIVSDRISAQET